MIKDKYANSVKTYEEKISSIESNHESLIKDLKGH